MNSVVITTVLIPGFVSVLLFLVFYYLHQQSRQPYFLAWQWAWAAYSLHHVLDAFPSSAVAFFVSELFLVAMALCIFVSTRLMRASYRFRWYDAVVGTFGVALALLTLRGHLVNGVFRPDAQPMIRLGVGLAVILLYCSAVFYVNSQRRGSLAFQVLAISLALWAVLLAVGQLQSPMGEPFGSANRLFGPVPQMLLGIAMVMVLFENQRNAVQENTLALSTLGVDPRRLLFAEDLVPNMRAALERLRSALPMDRAAIVITERWRGLLPSVQQGFSPEFLAALEKSGAGDYICELAYRQNGIFTIHDLAEMTEPLPVASMGTFAAFKKILVEAEVRNLTAVNLQTREHNFGVILLPHAERRAFGSSGPRLMVGLALQLGLTLENYVVSHDAHRRTKEYELLTDIGKAISSRLDQDEILRTIQVELGQIFDTSHFYIAFQESEQIRFELEVRDNRVLPKRSRELRNAFTEFVIRNGEPLLIRSDLENTRKQLGISHVPQRPAKCLIAAPIFLGTRSSGNKASGIMVAMNPDREFVFEQRDLDVLVTAAGQVSVAVENARLFGDELRRSRQLAFLNNVSRTAISSDDPVHMLGEIASEIQKNFSFDHIGVGLLDYGTKEIEIKAEAGVTAHAMGRRVPLGIGILGRVARTGERALVQNALPGNLSGILPDSRAVLCIPITYGESLMGVLNIESRSENAFAPQDVLILNTLADLLATALHNAFVFQKLQQQSITDGLTGIKTRRFFWEALSSEWKRASRSGRPFSVVLIDLDKFKEVNDSLGHLEGDLVLARVGRLLEQKCRQSNVVARYGGDEFIILMPETGIEQAQVLAERLRLWLATDPMLEEHKITGSFGVASFPVHGFSMEDLIRVADTGMYVAKHAGGNQVSTSDAFGEGSAVPRHLVSGYIEGFLQREHNGPEHLEELITTLRKLCGREEDAGHKEMKEAVEALSRAAELREHNAAGHGEQCAHYAGIIARGLNLSAEELEDVTFAARVHDVGKLFIPERILNKPGALTEEEFAVIKTHPQVGADVLRAIPEIGRVAQAVESHHEAFDGSGYPFGLKGEDIPLHGRIIAVADAYANMTSDRSFALARTEDQALAELSKMSGTRFDGMIVRLFVRLLKLEKAST